MGCWPIRGGPLRFQKPKLFEFFSQDPPVGFKPGAPVNAIKPKSRTGPQGFLGIFYIPKKTQFFFRFFFFPGPRGGQKNQV